MKQKQTYFLLLIFGVLLQIKLINAQTTIEFQNIRQTTIIYKPLRDTNYTFNFEYLSSRQIKSFGSMLFNFFEPRKEYTSFKLFRDFEEKTPCYNNEIRKELIIKYDSSEVDCYDCEGFVPYKVGGAIDSMWYFDNLQGVIFNEEWSFNKEKSTFNININNFAPLTLLKDKEDLGPQYLYVIKPSSGESNFKVIADFIITDVFAEQDPISQEDRLVKNVNTSIDFYPTTLLINSVIDKVKSGKLKGYVPDIPFTKQYTPFELKKIFSDEFYTNSNNQFKVRYKAYSFRFKLVEKWSFDPVTFSFKKEVLGIVLMKRNEKKDLSINPNEDIEYTFTSIVYVPFNTTQ